MKSKHTPDYADENCFRAGYESGYTQAVEDQKKEIANHQAINSLMAGDDLEVSLANKVFELRAEVDRLTKALRALYAHSPDLDDTSMSSDPSFTEAIINAKEILDNLK